MQQGDKVIAVVESFGHEPSKVRVFAGPDKQVKALECMKELVTGNEEFSNVDIHQLATRDKFIDSGSYNLSLVAVTVE